MKKYCVTFRDNGGNEITYFIVEAPSFLDAHREDMIKFYAGNFDWKEIDKIEVERK